MSDRPSENNVVGQGAASKILRRRIVLLRGFGALSRPVTVDGVGKEYGGADNAEKRRDCFQHDNDP
jgi:hypothetical protein